MTKKNKTIKKNTVPKKSRKVVAKKLIKKAKAKPILKRMVKKTKTKKITKQKVLKKPVIQKSPVKKITKRKAVRHMAPKKLRVSKNKPVVKIKVIGVGGGGGNALTRMSKDPIRGVEFVAINTDIQDLEACGARRKIHIGKTITRGMGAGMNPELGQQSAEEDRESIENALQGADMVFLTAGMGGGTGTGATPVVADIAKDMGILTVAVVTKPFSFEGSVRTRIAEEGLSKLRDRVDTLLVIPNDKVFNIIDANTPVVKAFDKIDEILKNSVRGVADMITSTGLVNVDFADITAVMKDAGIAVVGVGVAKGKDRASKAVGEAINSPLLDISIDGARGVLFSIAGGRDLKMSEINEAAQMITENVDSGAKIIFGAHHDRKLKKGDIKIVLIATGFNGSHQLAREDRFGLFNFGGGGEIEEELESDMIEEKSEEVVKTKKSAKKRIVSNEDEPINETEDDGTWDVPAFLRRRKKR